MSLARFCIVKKFQSKNRLGCFKPKLHYATFAETSSRGKSRIQIMKVGDMISVADSHDLCPRLSPRGSFGESRKVGVMKFGLYDFSCMDVNSA